MTIAHSQFATSERRQQIAALYLQRKMQSEIAREVGVTQQQISYDLKALRELWLASSMRDFDAAKSEELQRVDEAERQYWAGWQRSLQPREVTLTEATEGGESVAPDGTRHAKAPTRKASLRKEGQAGDPRFLDGVLKCVAQRCKILGLDVESQAIKDMSTGLADILSQAREHRSGGASLMAEA